MDQTSNPIQTNELPWMPLNTGVSVRLLRLVGKDRTLQLKVEPGTTIEQYTHGGEVHAFNVTGSRKLSNGKIAGP